MGLKEFSDQFDVLYNNITSNQAPGLNEYEKSVFLTKAQEEIIKNYFNPKANPKGDGFDDSPKRQADFSNIISYDTLGRDTDAGSFDTDSYKYVFPSDLFISLNEQLTYNNTPITVIPVSFDEYNRLMSKPYKYPPKYQAWRLITKNKEGFISKSQTVYYTGSAAGGDDYYSNYPITLTANVPQKVTLTIYGYSSSAIPSIQPGTVVVTGNATNGWYIGYKRTSNQSFSSAIAAINTNSNAYTKGIVSVGWNDNNNHASNSADISVTAQGMLGKLTVAEVRGRFDSAPEYRMRYVKIPRPIILINLGEDLKIHNQFGPSECELPEELHEEILQRAVELAKIAWTGNGNENTQLVIEAGKRSE